MKYYAEHKKILQDITEFTCDKINLRKSELKPICRNCKKRKTEPNCKTRKSIIKENPFKYFCDEYSERAKVIL